MMKRLRSFMPAIVAVLLVTCVIHTAGADSPAPESGALSPAKWDPGSEPTLFQVYGGRILVGSAVLALVLFVGFTIYRRRRETEARALAGKYIADGVEAAWLKFPDLLTMGADIPASKAQAVLDSLAEPQHEEFFSWAERNIRAMRKMFPDVGAVPESGTPQQLLVEIAPTLEAFKTKTLKPELRPAWQLAFVLDLLINRLRERPAEFTLSTARTIASALDVLAVVARPGVRPDLIVEPPISVLAVDDDPLCLRAVAFAIQKSGIKPDTAVDGAQSVKMCTEKIYDVVFMDIMMPGIDGLEACQQIRSIPQNANTPVVFVTARSDFQTRERSVEVGGAELIGKPFLVTEITVKAVTFSMRKRLNLPMTNSAANVASVAKSAAVANAA